MLNIFYTSKFKKDFKKMVKQGKPIHELEKIIMLLQQREVLPEKYRDHSLRGMVPIDEGFLLFSC